MTDPLPNRCPDCREGVSRRDFVRAAGGAVAAVSLAPFAGAARLFADDAAAPAKKPAAETAASRLFDSLSEEQRKAVCFPFDDPLRTKINANWAITKPSIEEGFNPEQRKLIDEIFRGVTSPDGYERFRVQMDEDQGGFETYHIALFGEPGSGKFEFEMTGRHLTIRADGDSVEGAAFGGPIVYGHGAGDGQKGLPGNVFYYQTKRANEVFQALDGKQRDKALVPKAPPESSVALQGEGGKFPGIGVGELSKDQQALVESVMRVILAPYRQQDIDEALEIMKAGGGIDALHMAFYQADDLGDDHEWDLWRLEGPTFVWHFRGAPHVHAYVNIAKKPA